MDPPVTDSPATEFYASSSRNPKTWINDWDLLSARFQLEATAYMQIGAVLVVALLIVKRAGLLGRPRSTALVPSQNGTEPSGAVSLPADT